MKYQIDETAFAVINSESAYWAGFLQADGCIHETRYAPSIRLLLSAADLDHVNQFRVFLKGSRPVTVGTRSTNFGTQHYAAFTVASHRLVNDLRTLGIGPGSHSVAPTLAMNRHFWRGVVDGDGWIGISGTPRFSLAAHRPLLLQFLTFCEETCGLHIPKSRIEQIKGIHQLRAGGLAAVRIIHALYSDAPVVLERKRVVGERILDSTTSPAASS
jgi:hypothetical protein